jgi:hypothetical protein
MVYKHPYSIFHSYKCSSNFSARYELGRYPIDNFIKTQSLLYEDRLLAVDTPETLKECFSLVRIGRTRESKRCVETFTGNSFRLLV